MSKLVSIVLPTYNGSRFIRESIESVLGQTYQNWELIIVNDCSTDETLEICEEYAKKDKRIRIISNEVNKKLPTSLNVGFADAKGEYYTWTSDDNKYLPTAIEKMVDYLDKHKETDMISMGYSRIDENGNIIRHTMKEYNRCQELLIIKSNCGACFMYTKEIAKKVGEYDPKRFFAEDLEYFMRIALNGKIDYLSEVLYLYREHPKQLVKKIGKVKIAGNGCRYDYVKKFLKKFHYSKLLALRIYIVCRHKNWLYKIEDKIIKPYSKKLHILRKIKRYLFIEQTLTPTQFYKKDAKNILVIFGTRPEAIKLAPVIQILRRDSRYNCFVCNTEQQKQLSNQMLKIFDIKADFKLDVMKKNQSLAGCQARILKKLSKIYKKYRFDATIVQGDTMSVLCGTLASFYNKVPVFHVEAGLRSYDLFEPFPEEAIRQMTARITDLHFAPTQKSYDCLIKEGIKQENISITGNTSIDAFKYIPKEAKEKAKNQLNLLFNKHGLCLDEDKLVLITAHRRENHGERINDIISAIKELATEYQDHQFLIPVHPNPNVHDKFHNELGQIKNIALVEPLEYPILVCVMENAKLILTDSGGIQEEAPSFGCPVLCLRYKTERMEGVEAGFVKLVGADKDEILKQSRLVLSKDKKETRMDGSKNPYGDGNAGEKIYKRINQFFNL